MTKEEIREVWAYLGTYRAGDKRLGDTALANAWWRALKGYEAKDVKAAIDVHFRRCKFFPDLGEIFPLLPGGQEGRRACEDATRPGGGRFAAFSARWDREMAAGGWPSLGEWLARGEGGDAWWARRGRCQLNDPEWMALLTEQQREELRATVEREEETA